MLACSWEGVINYPLNDPELFRVQLPDMLCTWIVYGADVVRYVPPTPSSVCHSESGVCWAAVCACDSHAAFAA